MSSRITSISAGLFLVGLLLSQPALTAPAMRLPPLTLKVLPGTDPSVLNDLVNIRPVKGGAPAQLQLDLAHGRILDTQGRILVETDGRNPIHLQGTVDKWRYVGAFAALAAAHPQEIHFDWGLIPKAQQAPPMPWLYQGESLTVMVTVAPSRQVAVFNLASIGILRLLYAREGGGDGTVVIPAHANSPFGVDHVIAVSAVDPEGMHRFIGWLAETARARGMVDSAGAVLQQITTLHDVRVGMQVLYTCLSPAECKR